MTQRKGLRGILALLCAMTLLIGAIGPAWATEAAPVETPAVQEAAPLTDGGTPEAAPVPDGGEVTPVPNGEIPAPEGNTPAANGETPAPAPETPQTIAYWKWVDPNGYLEEGVLKQPDVSEQAPVQFGDVTVFLPKEITAKVEGSEEDVTIPVEGWECLSFGDMSTGGDYTFTAKLSQGYTLKEGVAALEVQVKLGQPGTDDAGDTTGNAAASDVITVESWNWVDSKLNDDGKLHLTKEITDENLPEIQKLLPQSIQAGEHTISLTWTYSKETKTFTAKLPDGYALKEGAAPLAVAVVVEQVMVLPADGNTVYVGGVALAGSSDSIVYATTNENGEVITEGAAADKYNIKWDGNTLTLKGAYITKEVSTPGLSSPVEGAAIGVYNQSGDANLTITLEGTNTIKDVSAAIYVFASSGSASLTITGDGILSASSGFNPGIRVQSNTGNGTLAITGAKVTASSSSSGNGVQIRVGDGSNASLTVNSGSLTATGSGATFAGIQMQFGSSVSSTGTPTVTVSGNAIVRANGSAGGIASNSSTPIQFGAGPGIVFDGKSGTVYGNVTLQEDLTINQGESLKLDNGASLNAGGYNVIVAGGTLDEDLANSLGDSVKYAPAITTTSLPEGQVGTAYNQTLTATGDDPITWSVSGSLPAGLSLSEDGKITGTPTTAGDYKFTVTATNASGSDSKEYTIKIAAVADTTAPKLTAGTVNRTSDANATVTFNADEAGTYFYKVVDSGAALPTDIISGNGTAMVSGENTITLTNLTAGAKDIYIVAKDAADNKSDTLKMEISAYTPPAVSVSITFQNYTGKTYDGKAMANPTKDQLTVTGADFSEVTFTWYKDTKAEENKLTTAPTDAGTYVLVAAVAKTDSHGEASAQKGITITKADATDAMKKAEGTMIKNHESSLTLPTLPDGASYGTPTGNGTYVTDLRVSDGKLAYKGTSNVVNDGKYEVKVPVLNAKNYNNYDITVTFTGQEKLPVTLTAANFTTTYNGSEVFPEAIHKTATYDGEAVSGTWSFEREGGNPKNAGTYKDIELKFTPNSDKYATASIKLDVVIKKAPLKISVKLSKTKIAVNSKLPTVSLGYSGLVGNEKLDPDVEPKFEGMPTGKKTGTYTISLKNVDEVKEAINALSASENYDITYVTSAKLSVVSGNNPLTADTSHIGMWTAIMVISGIGLIVVLVVMVVMNKKSKRRRPRYRRTPPKQEEE